MVAGVDYYAYLFGTQQPFPAVELYSVVVRQTRVRPPTDDDLTIYRLASELLGRARPPGRPVRLLGVGVSDLRPADATRQGLLFEDPAPGGGAAGPAINATVSNLDPLMVTWTVPSQGKSAELETRDYGPVVMPDNGVFQIPAGSNPARADQRIRLYRFNELDIAGGLLGSRMRVKIRQTVEPIIVQ